MQGHLWHPSLLSGYADNYLGFWLAEKGEPVLEIPPVEYEYLRSLIDLDERVYRAGPEYVSRRMQSCEVASQLMYDWHGGPYIS